MFYQWQDLDRGDAGKRKSPVPCSAWKPRSPAGIRLRPDQPGYRVRRGCIEQIFTVRRIFEICDQYLKYSAVPVFVDFSKALD
jgi:hypothetical protein